MRIVFLTLFFFFTLPLWSQDPVLWQYKAKPHGKDYLIELTAYLQPGWHLYSQSQPQEAIVLPTTITFHKNPSLFLAGKTLERGELQIKSDPILGMESFQYAEQVSFQQKISLKKVQPKTLITGEIMYQVCTDEKCLPPRLVPFTLSIE